MPIGYDQKSCKKEGEGTVPCVKPGLLIQHQADGSPREENDQAPPAEILVDGAAFFLHGLQATEKAKQGAFTFGNEGSCHAGRTHTIITLAGEGSMNNPIYEVKVPLCVEGAELAGALDGEGFLGSWEQDGLLVLYWRGREADILPCVQAGLHRLGIMIPESAMRLEQVIEKDWNAQWAASVHPVRVGRRLGIRPGWMSMELPEDGIELVIDPRQAFGTGHHATTQLMLERLEDMTWPPGSRVLDVGTGSGILSMAALRLGASYALGIDIDQTAIECAREYAFVNHFQEELEFRVCRLEEVPTQEFHVILANVDRRTLVSLCEPLAGRRSSATQLLVSGLLDEDEQAMISHFQQAGWMHHSTTRRGEWIALHLVSPS